MQHRVECRVRLFLGKFGFTRGAFLRLIEDGVDFSLHPRVALRDDGVAHHRPRRQLFEERGVDLRLGTPGVLLTEGDGTVTRWPLDCRDGQIAQPLLTKAPDAALARVIAFVVGRLSPENHLP